MNTILITGASGGIGAALARRYAAPGTRLVLCGRDAGRLQAAATACRAQGALVEQRHFDLMDVDFTIRALRDIDRTAPIDLAIFNAGLGGVSSADRPVEAPERALAIATVNFTSTAVGATTVGDLMRERGRGQIAIIGSVAEMFPLPMAPTYSGAKAGLVLFAEALDIRLREHGVAVTLVSPGFVETPMSQGLSNPRPFLIGAEKAAGLIASQIARKARHAVIPWQMALLCGLCRFLPRAVVRLVLQRF